MYFFQKEIMNSLFEDFQKKEETLPPDEKNPSKIITEEKEGKKEERSQHEINQAKVREKIEKIKKRLALKGVISQGDDFFRNDQLWLALKSYTQAYKKNKTDGKIIKKLGDTYFEMHKFTASQKYYSKIIDYSWFDTNTLALAIMYAGKYETPEQRNAISLKLKDAWLSKDALFYYTNSLLCLEDFHSCKLNYDKYGESNKSSEEGKLLSHTKKEDSSNNYENKKETQDILLTEIKTTIQNYRNFQLDEVYFKDALLVWAFYKNKNYPIAIELWRRLLEQKPGYRPIIKIIADSYFQLWDYNNAKKYLSQYYEIDKEDGGVTYLLWIVSSEFWDYVLSNIYLNKSLQNGYNPTINIRRKLVYNYFLLESRENIINSFHDLIEKESSYEKSDLELAIYYYILYKEYDQAKIWIKQWMNKYPTEENFHGYLWWIKKELWDNKWAMEEFKKGLVINKKNPFINFNIGLLKKETWSFGPALIYFKRTIKHSPDSEFAIQAEQQLDKLNLSKNK